MSSNTVAPSISDVIQPLAPTLPVCPVPGGRLRFMEPMLPSLDKVMACYQSAHQGGQVTNAALVSRFEDAAAERLHVRHSIAVSSCTNGLVMLLRCLGLTGEVILPSFTFFATGHAVLWNGLQPVFADCDPDTWNIDPLGIERLITERTSALLGVHMYGNPCDVETLSRIATKHGLHLVFDAAHGFGSEYGGRPVGQFGEAEVFSLSPTKLLVAGEGGLIATNDGTLARMLRAARNYGDLGGYDPELLGLSARMTEFAAALALAGLEILDAKIARRNVIAASYTALLSAISGLSFQKVHPEDRSTYKDYSVHIDSGTFPLERDQVAEALAAQNIETRKYFYPPLHRQKLYQKYYQPQTEPLRRTNWLTEGVLSLPMYESLTDEAVERVVNVIRGLSIA